MRKQDGIENGPDHEPTTRDYAISLLRLQGVTDPTEDQVNLAERQLVDAVEELYRPNPKVKKALERLGIK